MRRGKQRPKHLVDHVGFFFDASSSMVTSRHVDAVIKAAEVQVEFLAQQSDMLGREIRVSVWSFADEVENLIWDMDVKHLPSIRDLYDPNGNTALIDACLTGIQDLSEVSTKYGNHAFLLWLLTDGMNNINGQKAPMLQERLKALPENWTFGALVPNQQAVFAMKNLGFAAGNIAVWDTTSRTGAEEAGNLMRQATQSFTTARASGVNSTTGLFDNTTVTAAAAKANLVALTGAQFHAHPVITTKHVNHKGAIEIKAYVELELGKAYTAGDWYYQLMKPEKIAPDKQVAVRERKTKKIFAGANGRAFLNLPDHEIRVKPGFNPECDIFVQSKSTNRYLPVGTTLLHIPS